MKTNKDVSKKRSSTGKSTMRQSRTVDISFPEPNDTEFRTVVIDLDGVLAENVWPDRGIGQPIQRGVEMLRYYASRGFYIVVWTARGSKDSRKIWAWFTDLQLPVDKLVCGKPSAAIYIDDRAYRPEWCK